MKEQKNNELLEEGAFAFDVDNKKLLEKTLKFRFADPYEYINEFMRYANSAKPSKISVKAGRRKVVIEHDGEGISRGGIESIVNEMLAPRKKESYQTLSMGVLSALSTNPRYIEIDTANGNEKIKMLLGADYGIDIYKGRREKGTKITIRRKSSNKNVPEKAKILKNCVYTKVPLYLNRRKRNRRIDNKNNLAVFRIDEDGVDGLIAVPKDWRKEGEEKISWIHLMKNNVVVHSEKAYGKYLPFNAVVNYDKLNLIVSRNDVVEDENYDKVKETIKKAEIGLLFKTIDSSKEELWWEANRLMDALSSALKYHSLSAETGSLSPAEAEAKEKIISLDMLETIHGQKISLKDLVGRIEKKEKVFYTRKLLSPTKIRRDIVNNDLLLYFKKNSYTLSCLGEITRIVDKNITDHSLWDYLKDYDLIISNEISVKQEAMKQKKRLMREKRRERIRKIVKPLDDARKECIKAVAYSSKVAAKGVLVTGAFIGAGVGLVASGAAFMAYQPLKYGFKAARLAGKEMINGINKGLEAIVEIKENELVQKMKIKTGESMSLVDYFLSGAMRASVNGARKIKGLIDELVEYKNKLEREKKRIYNKNKETKPASENIWGNISIITGYIGEKIKGTGRIGGKMYEFLAGMFKPIGRGMESLETKVKEKIEQKKIAYEKSAKDFLKFQFQSYNLSTIIGRASHDKPADVDVKFSNYFYPKKGILKMERKKGEKEGCEIVLNNKSPFVKEFKKAVFKSPYAGYYFMPIILQGIGVPEGLVEKNCKFIDDVYDQFLGDAIAFYQRDVETFKRTFERIGTEEKKKTIKQIFYLEGFSQNHGLNRWLEKNHSRTVEEVGLSLVVKDKLENEASQFYNKFKSFFISEKH